jgi:hypothetical protein
MAEDRKKRRQHQPTEQDSRRFVRVREDALTDETIRGIPIGPEDMLEIEELPRFSDEPDVDTGTHAPFIDRFRADPDQPARLADIEVIWSRLTKVRGEQRRGRRETERRDKGVSDAVTRVLEFQFKVRILWALAVGGLVTGGGSAVAVVRGLQDSASAAATSEYRLRAAEDSIRDAAPRLRAAESAMRIYDLRIDELSQRIDRLEQRIDKIEKLEHTRTPPRTP